MIIKEIPLKSLDETISFTQLEWLRWAKEQLGYIPSNKQLQPTANDAVAE